MAAKWNWDELAEKLEEDGPFSSMASAAKWLGIPRATVRDAFYRGDLPESILAPQEADLPDGEEPDQVSFRKRGNEATLRYRAAEPLDAEDVMALANVDSDEWRVVDQTVNMWQMGRKGKEVNLKWTGGKADGYVKDTGKIHKSYLYKIEIKLTRRNRVAVKPVFQPIELAANEPAETKPIQPSEAHKILFIADPHFGFRRHHNRLEPMHDRRFIASLLQIHQWVHFDTVVWNGDALDLAGWSSFDTEPELLYSTQLAGMELAWIMREMGRYTRRQILIEGNHEVRMRKAIIKNMKSGYQLKPVHELDGAALLSVPRFLGLEKMGVEWVGNYPDGEVKIGGAVFSHGNVARKGSAKTIASMMTEAAVSRFFGHIHRFEMASKTISDLETQIYMGSPGCACRPGIVPGSSTKNNWQVGAFAITTDDRQVLSVEHIAKRPGKKTTFRGYDVAHMPYMPYFLESIPAGYRDAFK